MDRNRGRTGSSMKYLDRTLIRTPIDYCLCTNEKEFYKELKKLEISDYKNVPFLDAGYAAYTHSLFKNGKLTCIVTLDINRNISKRAIRDTLIHEAVHIFQDTKKRIMEDAPSPEFEAYSIQNIASNLIDEYELISKKHKAKNKY